VTLPVVLVSLRDSPADKGLGLDGEPLERIHEAGEVAAGPTGAELGFSAQESRRLPRFWTMLTAFLVLAFAIGGIMLQLVPILRARGVSAEQAASIQGALGLALILGRAFAGFLMDRMFAPYVASAIIIFPIVGAALLANGAAGVDALVAAIFIGLAAGAELDVIAYLVTRYFGTRGYAENYGWLYAAWTLGSGTAPVLTAYVFDVTGSHSGILWFYAALFAVSALLVLRLGPYPDLAHPRGLARTRPGGGADEPAV
jgi:MFS family permease